MPNRGEDDDHDCTIDHAERTGNMPRARVFWQARRVPDADNSGGRSGLARDEPIQETQ